MTKMRKSYYSKSVTEFLLDEENSVLGELTRNHQFLLEEQQRNAWIRQIQILKEVLKEFKTGQILFEYSIPRMGKRIDVLLILGPIIFVLEFKIGETEFSQMSLDQVWDYALDLKYFHETSHDQHIAPILIATHAQNITPVISLTPQNDKLFFPIKANEETLKTVLENTISFSEGKSIDSSGWELGRYAPTPTIIEAAMALYKNHSVNDISRHEDKDAINLTKTSEAISQIIHLSKKNSRKSLCFVTGVPGAGKTLVGLNIATTHIDEASDMYSVFLSGNDPLVKILREALARDKVKTEKKKGHKLKKVDALREVKLFIQNVHHFRDDCLRDITKPPIEHVALFDEAQRAWNLQQTANFMHRKKGVAKFNQSEPEFLISCLDRHPDWAVVVCLVGGGQEINTGEAGISEWIDSLNRSFSKWDVYISPKLTDNEYGAGKVLEELKSRKKVEYKEELHLSVSMRSFRSEKVSLFVKQLLDLEIEGASKTLQEVKIKYPIVVTRDLSKAKNWLKSKARGSERYGMVVSSQAERLKPHAIDVKSPMDPVHWFLDGKEDVRSSYYLEDVATEFHVQGLELDWTCVVWDADFRYTPNGWKHHSFCGDSWNNIKKIERQNYLKNAYRVLLTRARQGMVIVVPQGDVEDQTRKAEFYDATYQYLKKIGIEEV